MTSKKNQQSQVVEEVTAQETADKTLVATDDSRNKPEHLEWLQDAGFGMFIHWSVDVQLGCVISHALVGASADFIDRYFHELPSTFNPDSFRPDRIAALAKLAGMQYIVLTTKHHNGFCLWDTKTTSFNIMSTPYQKDVLKEYVDAVRAQGLKVGFYYSPEDFLFLHEQGQTITRNFKEPHSPELLEKYNELIAAQCTELMTQYGKIDMMFFDGSPKEVAKKVCWDLQPDILITRGAIMTPEQRIPGKGYNGPWETNITMGTGWQFQPTHETYKSGTKSVEMLIETRAKGGALLYNIGLDSYGRIPEVQEGLLREMALWNFMNKESVQDTRPWIITQEDNIWFTRKKNENTVYAFLTKLPDWKRGQRREFLLKSIQLGEASTLSVLGQSSELMEYRPDFDASCRMEQTEDGVLVSVVPAQRVYDAVQWPNPIVLKITDVRPAFDPPEVDCKENALQLTPDGSATLTGVLISLGDADEVLVGFEYRVYPGFAFETSGPDWEELELKPAMQPGSFRTEFRGHSGETYQCRAIVKHPKITMRSGNQIFRL